MDYTDLQKLAEAYASVYSSQEVEQVDENRAAMGRINKEYHRKKEAEAMAARARDPKVKRDLPKRKNDNPMYDPKSAGSSRVKGFKFTGEEVESEAYEPMTKERQMRVDRAKKKAYDADKHAQYKGDSAEADKQFKRRMAMDSRTKMRKEELEASGLFTDEEISAILEADEQFDEAMSSYDRNRKRAAQRAAARNAARDAGKTGAVPGVGYVSPRRERETYVDSAGVTRHKSGAKMP